MKCDGTQWFATPQSSDGFCVDGTEAAPAFASGTALVAPAITGAATIASGATITTPTLLPTVADVTATGATGTDAAALGTVTPTLVTVTGASGAGVRVGTGVVGAFYLLKNAMTGVFNVYASGSTINGVTGTTAYAITATGNKLAWLFCRAAGAWQIGGNT